MSMYRNPTTLFLVACFAMLVMMTNSAKAVVFASESFDYATGQYLSSAPPPGPGDFSGLNGGLGWSTPFRSHIGAGSDIHIASGPTGGFFDGVASTVDTNSFRRDRIMSAPTSNAAGTETWQVMYLSTAGVGGGGFQVNNSNGGQDYQLAVDGSNNYALIGGHGGAAVTQNSSIAASSSVFTPDIVLFKTVAAAGGQLTTSAWIAPDLSQGEGGLGTPSLNVNYAAFAGNANIGQINVNPNSNIRLDEIVFGTSFTDVADALPALPPPPPAGDLIGLNFAGANNNPGGRKVIATGTTAGAPTYEQSSWNNTPGTAQVGTPSSANDTLLNLIDSNGLATSVDVTFSSPQTWGNNFGSNPSGDQQLNGNGITDGTPTVTVSEITFDEYDVVVYIGIYPPGRNSTYTLVADGQTMERFAFAQDWALFDTTGYLEVTDAAIDAGSREQGNYLVFSGLTASSFTLSSVGGGGISGIQLVNTAVLVPEPTTAVLFGFATFGLAIRRRRSNRLVVRG